MGRRLISVGVGAVLLTSLAVPGAGAEANDIWPTYGPTNVLNPGGGITGDDGLRITFGGSQLTVQRFENPDRPGEPNNEIYDQEELPGSDGSRSVFSQVALAVGDTASGGVAFVAAPFLTTTSGEVNSRVDAAENVTLLPWTATATATAGQIVQTLTGVTDGRTYTVTVTVSYTAPEDRFRIEYDVDVPAGNTAPVRLYHLVDTYLGGSDEGPGFFTDPVECGAGGRSGAIVGVDRADQGVVQAFQYVSGAPWSSYMSGYYNDVVFGKNVKTDPDAYGEGPNVGPGFLNDLNNQIITDEENDNGIGISWNFGATPGTYSSVAKMIFRAESVDPCEDTDAVGVTNPDPTVVPDPVIDPEVLPDPVDPLKDPDPVDPVDPVEPIASPAPADPAPATPRFTG